MQAAAEGEIDEKKLFAERLGPYDSEAVLIDTLLAEQTTLLAAINVF